MQFPWFSDTDKKCFIPKFAANGIIICNISDENMPGTGPDLSKPAPKLPSGDDESEKEDDSTGGK